ncbi:putative F-box domain, leucine-rich repeat domain, L domain-containing protein [Rosa chinensis]|uniref:Putative F-box domain, leucine-rich repeat domain, L domain-containing protein n=1 Tax=Rosa chinensis TaxID=74649 RepID=A0A2P6S2N0_ROSCH|nr:putative F-box/FBD/LRR-repeat protein At5g44950 [Rosa chinensis]PRQ52916.1 putative F-box domain, leucine-rich repeat domain, L domain-containing protein [Rosa chinensis]
MEATTMTNRNPNRSLNDLPDEILLHILSFFPTLDAVQTSLISRKWRPLWSRLRFLKFSYEHFPLNDPPSDNRDFFAEFVDRALILRPHSPIDLFSLSFIYHDRFGFHVDSWVRCAVTLLHARELHLDFFIDREYHQTDETFNHKYDFPFAVLRNGAVRVLKLTRVDLTLPASMAAMGLVSLSSMYLDEVYLTDQMVCDLISGCPNLEELELQNCWGMEKMKICSKKLKKLAFAYIYDSDNRNTIEIDCPNLCSISFDNCSFTQFVLKFAPALVEFSVSIVRIMEQDYGLWSRIVRLLEQAPYVKQLNLQNWWFKLLTSKDPFSKSFMLHNLNHLELRTGYTQCDLIGLAALLELSPNLKNMTLDYVEDGILPEEFSNKPDGFHMPSLRQVTMKSYSGTPDENNFVNILKKHGVVLEKIVIHHIKVGEKSFSPVVLSKIPCKV